MKAQLEKRLSELKSEYESGQKALAELETKQANLRTTLLRISGAIQVLEEELGRMASENKKSVQQLGTEPAETVKPEK